MDNYSGKKFGSLLVLEKVSTPNHLSQNRNNNYVKCKCDCGNEVTCRYSQLTGHKKTKCNSKDCSIRNYSKVITSMIGNQYGSLSILEVDIEFNSDPLNSKKIKDASLYVKCLCICGIQKTLPAKRVRRGDIISCGCATVHNNSDDVLKSSANHIYQTVYMDGDLTFEDFFYLSQQDCTYCGCKPYNLHNSFKKKDHSTEFSNKHGDFIYNGLDRVDSTRGHYKDNVVTCCRRCNSFKSNMTLEDFKNQIIKIYSHRLKN